MPDGEAKSITVRGNTMRLAMFCKSLMREANPELYKRYEGKRGLPTLNFVTNQALTYFKAALIAKYPNEYLKIKKDDPELLEAGIIG